MVQILIKELVCMVVGESFLKAGSQLCGAVRLVADTSEIRQGMRLGAARRVEAKVSCFKIDRVVSLVLLREEAENEEYEVRNKRKRFWVYEINLTRNAYGEFSTLFKCLNPCPEKQCILQKIKN